MNIISSKTFPNKNENKIKAKTLKIKQIVKSANYDQMPSLSIHSPQKLHRTMPIYFLPLIVHIKVNTIQL